VPVSSPSPPSLPPRLTPTRLLLSAAIYPAAVWASFRLLALPGSTAILWPAAGLLLGCLLLLPARAWLPTVAAAWTATTAVLTGSGVPLPMAVPLAGIGVAEPLLAAWALQRWRPAIVQWSTTTDMFALAVVGLVCATIGASVAAAIGQALGVWNAAVQPAWLVGVFGHAVGFLLFAPLCLTWKRWPGMPATPAGPARIVEAVIAFGALAGVTTLVFFDGIAGIDAPLLLSLPYEILPFGVLIALRFGVRGCVMGMVVVALLAIAGTAGGGGPFRLTHLDLDHRVLATQWFTATSTLVSVLLALAVEQGRFQKIETRLLNDSLAEANGVLVHEIGERERTALSLRMLLDAAPEGIVVVDQQGVIVEVNSALERMFGYTRGQLLGQSGDMLVEETDRPTLHASRLRYMAAPAGMPARGSGPDLQALRSDGGTFPAQVGLSPYRLGDELRIIATVRDVTERRAAERRMETSLREKEVLLREVHHRVKNNMAVMSSLFFLQQRYASDPDTARVFRESESRVRSMAMVHEVLYRSSDLSAVDFSRYLESLVEHLANVYRGMVPGLRLERHIEPIRLSLDQAVPCGLLLNEVLTNAFKHAFIDGAPAVLRVQARARDGAVHIDIVDNGVGVPEHVSPAGVQTLGMRLMQALNEQLEGTLDTVRQERGTRTTLVFPLVVGAAATTMTGVTSA
jgi:PAS domain S-box-containing protein